ncbi:hypothetical protein [Lentzea sp. NPDC059081]|uniref:hypothetical protein n=1 Tax=Lentzea sp. NPDC059081 TaxID=3346719 RepID=UPI003687634E
MSAAALALAAALPRDPDHDLVVVDIGIPVPAPLLTALADALPRGRRGVRLMFPGAGAEQAVAVGRWLAAHLLRTFLVPSDPSDPLISAAGAGGGTWIRIEPGRAPEWDVRGFPLPSDLATQEDWRPATPSSQAETLPVGVWLRPEWERFRLPERRAELERVLPRQSAAFVVVLGGAGQTELDLGSVARFWATLTPADRARARFAQYGPVNLPQGRDLGQALAGLLGEEVSCYNGFPVAPELGSGARTVLPGGQLGWCTFAQVFSSGPGTAPRLREHRAPVDGLEEVSPGAYRWSPQAFVEVVRAGLWVRPPVPPAHADEVRAVPLDPGSHVLLYEPALCEAALQLADRLEEPVRAVSRLVPVAWPEAPPVVPVGEPFWRHVGPDEAAPQPPEPAPGDEEPDLLWLSRLVDPSLYSAAEEPAAPVGVAVASDARTVGDEKTESGAAASGDGLFDVEALRSQPHHRGATIVTLTLTDEQRNIYRHGDVLTQQGLSYALTAPCATQDGDVDLVVWSVTGRLCAELETGAERVDGRVVFLPGTRFKVLGVAEPTPAVRGRIVLRELSVDRSATDGGAPADESALDRFVLLSLSRAADRWAREPAKERVPAAVAFQFEALPGFVE